MHKTLTLVANQPLHTQAIRQLIAPFTTILNITARHENVWDIDCPTATILTEAFRQTLYQQHIDFALQESKHVTKKLLLSDMDATIVVGETIEEMASVLGLTEQVSQITTAAMQGHIDYREALAKRLQLLKGIPKATVIELAEKVTLAKGAPQLMQGINEKSMDSCLISGGFSLFTEVVSQKLGFKRHLSNRLSYDDADCLDGHWIGDLVTAEVKASTLQTLAAENDIDIKQTVAIGDGANDIKMLRAAGLGVAYYGKPVVRASVNAEIHAGTIDNLLWFIND